MPINVRVAAAKALALVRRDGLVATAQRAVWYVTPHATDADPFDVARGTNTGGVIPPWKLGADATNARFATQYQASDPKELTDAVGFAQIDPSTLSFIDLGCGKGRTLVVAAELGFRCIVGVEFAPDLVEIARTNLEKLSIGASTKVLCLDASQYPFPHDDFVLYMYNPFSAEVMRRVVENLSVSQAKTVTVIYKRPLCSELFDRCNFLARLGSPPGNADVIVWASQH